jgi:glycerol-3-phosphate O-acyltransferase
VRRTRAAIRAWLDHAVLRAIYRFRTRLDRYKLASKRTVRGELLADPLIRAAITADAATRGVPELDARVRVEGYIDEIVPQFNVLSYYKFGYNVARGLTRLLYNVTSEYQDRASLDRIPRRDIVVYLMNHRSNADYVVVAYVLARAVSISYAVGEWARVWPLEYVFKSFGAYFVRRGFRDPLYHTVLRRYVQLITRNGVTQGIFLEGGLSRDGALRPAKIGLLDYIVGTLPELPPDRDIWLVPVAINYDRTLEDRTLIRELTDALGRRGRVRQLWTVAAYMTQNLLRLLSGNLKRYGRAAVNFGSPISVRTWTSDTPGVLAMPKAERLPRVQALAERVLRSVAGIMPVTPVPLVAAALLSFDDTVVRREVVLERIDAMRDHLVRSGAKLVQPERSADRTFDRAWRTFRMRRLVVKEGDSYVILPSQRPLLQYYANSIRHLLPAMSTEAAMHPAHEPDKDLPALRPWRPG